MVKGKRLHTKKWQRCVRKVKMKDKGVNPFAVCSYSIGYKGSILKQHRKKSALRQWIG